MRDELTSPGHAQAHRGNARARLAAPPRPTRLECFDFDAASGADEREAEAIVRATTGGRPGVSDEEERRRARGTGGQRPTPIFPIAWRALLIRYEGGVLRPVNAKGVGVVRYEYGGSKCRATSGEMQRVLRLAAEMHRRKGDRGRCVGQVVRAP